MKISKAILATALAAATVSSVVPAAAEARPHRERHYRDYDRRGDYRDDYRYRCRKSGGTTGLLLGGVAGAGRTVAHRPADGAPERRDEVSVGSGHPACTRRTQRST